MPRWYFLYWTYKCSWLYLEVNISQEGLDRFLKVAEKLELEGLLTSMNDEFEPRNDEKPFGTEPPDGHRITKTESFSTKQMNTGSSSNKQKNRIVMDANDFSTNKMKN